MAHNPITVDVVPAFSQQVDGERRFSLGLQPIDSRNVHIVSGGWELCVPDYLVSRNDIPALALEFVADGDGKLTLDDKEFALSAGMIYTYGPGMSHRISGQGANRLSKYFVNTYGTAAQAILSSANLKPGSVVRVSEPARIRTLFDQLVDAGVRHTQHSPGICGHLYQALVLAIVEHGIAYGDEDLAGFATFQRCRSFIEEHHATVNTLEEVALRCEVSPAYLCRMFQAYAHQTPYQYLTRLKMQRAAQMLESRMKAKDVAKALGFADQFHFSRCFSRVFGLSPRRFVALAKPKSSSPA